MMADKGKFKYSDCAVLYRMNALSRNIETTLHNLGIPFRVYGGMRFYDRKEIKDIVAYLTLLENPLADTAFLRIVNTPKRGIGAATLTKLAEFAALQGLSLLEAAENADAFMKGGRSKFAPILDVMHDLAKQAEGMTVGEIVELVFERTGYHAMLILEDEPTTEAKIENVQELINSAHVYDKQAEEPSLEEYLSTVSLITDIDDAARFQRSGIRHCIYGRYGGKSFSVKKVGRGRETG